MNKENVNHANLEMKFIDRPNANDNNANKRNDKGSYKDKENGKVNSNGREKKTNIIQIASRIDYLRIFLFIFK